MKKPFITIEGQYQLLLSRGLIIQNAEEAKEYLLCNNYYNVVNGHGHFLISTPNHYLPGSDFLEIVAIHQFDSQFKNILFRAIIKIENMFVSVLSHMYSEAYQTEQNPYLNPANYSPSRMHSILSFQTDLRTIIRKYSSSTINNPVRHYVRTYGHVPLWVLSNYMTFGQTATLFGLATSSVRNSTSKCLNIIISKNLELQYVSMIAISPKDYDRIIGNMRDIRNLLAYDNMLYGYRCKGSFPYIPAIHLRLGIRPRDSRLTVYDVFVVARLFMSNEHYTKMDDQVHELASTLHSSLHTIDSSVILGSLGFPNDYTA